MLAAKGGILECLEVRATANRYTKACSAFQEEIDLAIAEQAEARIAAIVEAAPSQEPGEIFCLMRSVTDRRLFSVKPCQETWKKMQEIDVRIDALRRKSGLPPAEPADEFFMEEEPPPF